MRKVGPGILGDNASELRRAALVGGNDVAVGENASSAERFAPGFECRLFMGQVVDVNVKGHWKD